MQPTISGHPQNGTRRPVEPELADAWAEVEATLAHGGQPSPPPGAPQTGSRTPAEYTDVQEPPEEPPILTYRPYAPRPWTPPPPREEDPTHHHPGQPHPTPSEPHPPHGEPHAGHAPEPVQIVDGGSGVARQNQLYLTSAARAELHRRLRDYIASAADPVSYHRENGHVHGTPAFLPWHRQFLLGFERWQRYRLAMPGAFIPLAFWDTADPLPPEFVHANRNSPVPQMPPLPASLNMDRLAQLDYATFSSALEAHHNVVHDRIGGDMRDPRVSPNDTCFWLLHAYYDHLFGLWQTLRGESQGAMPPPA
jgi:hypothetical protein